MASSFRDMLRQFLLRRSPIVTVFAWLFVGATVALAQTNLPNARVGVAYSYQVTTTPASGPGSIYGATGLPTGISINTSTGLVSGTPTTAGTYNGTISVTENGLTDNFAVVLVVDPPLGTPVINSATTLSGTVGTAISTYFVTASNSPTSFNVGALPAGLSLGGTVTVPTISGTPTTAGTYTVSLSANNATGTGATTTLTITIAPAGPLPAITSATSATATLNAAFTYTITASNSPVSFSASGLPFGLSVNTTTGAITGTPTVAGVYTVALTATNNNGTSATTNLSLSVGSVPTMTSATTASATVGSAFTFTFGASNSAFSFNVSGLPPGLSVNASTGAITGTQTTPGGYTVTASANNATGTSASSTLTINVAAASSGGGGGGGTQAVAPVIVSLTPSFSVVAGNPASFTVSASGTGTLTYQWRKSGTPISGATASTYTIAKVLAADAGSYDVVITNSVGSTTSATVTLSVTALVIGPTITTHPQSAGVVAGGSITLTAVATGTGTLTYQWSKNGVAISGATSTSLALANVQLADVASYTIGVTDVTGTTNSRAAAVGINSTAKVGGSGSVVRSDIVHPNGNVYDQILLTGSSATITAEAKKVTRISFIDLNDDIVQVEFSGAGTAALSLENPTGPAAPVKYNQPGVFYMKGHASIIVTGANETSNLAVFTVGTITAVNQALFPNGTTYDGVADIGLISIATTNGKFGGIRAGNASFFRTTGLTGISAPGVAVQGPVFIGDITADANASSVMIFGSTTDVRITGGDLQQLNNRPVQVDGITRVNFTAGTKSSGATLPVQANRARLEQDGVDVTTQLVPP